VNVARLRSTILAAAEAEAQALVADAEHRAAVELERARERAAELVRRAGVDGRRAGELESARARALARPRAAALVLEAKRDAYESFRRDALASSLRLRSDEQRYRALLERLEREARGALGTDAELEVDPEGAGGLRARAGRRSVDLTLPVLVDRCVGALGARVVELWR
jgi:vacuolar-type H+-ATPase subunit E/Vma4